MHILGVCDSQDAGVALFDTEKSIITAINEERLSRIKLVGGFPVKSILELFRISGIETKKINLAVLASKMTPCYILRSLPAAHNKLRRRNGQFSFLLVLYIIYQIIACKSFILEKIETALANLYLRRKLKKIGIKCRTAVVEHHTAHAYAAYTMSGFDQALIFTIDGLGDGVSFTVSIGENGKIRRICEQSAFNDITLYYSRLTEFLGFKPIQDEGKVMGLAAYCGKTPNLGQAKNLLGSNNGRFNCRNLLFNLRKDKKYFQTLKTKNKEQIAAYFQGHLETEIVAVISYWIKKTGIRKIALGGGVFANIKVNQKISELNEVDSVYICPHMGDGGLALGAVFSMLKCAPFQPKDIFWGPSYSNEEIRTILDRCKIKFEFIDDIEKKTAVILAQDKIVARFFGAMEYGPRALGNRSILASAANADMPAVLNKKLGRDKFMPFAPSILDEYKDKCCLNTNKAEYSGNFMTISFNCTEYFKKNCPAVVHKDKTTRPQFISKSNNIRFHRVIDEYRKIVGIPAILNTSFNIHEEPIVCTPEDALNVFFKSGLDYLALENFLIKRMDT
ncbi:MAG: hypothetical protein KKA52_04140 [Candidatus Omnitrophica bacterium]|nr:hypothetical protein [Candidatus Omnitrophota bacterium]